MTIELIVSTVQFCGAFLASMWGGVALHELGHYLVLRYYKMPVIGLCANWAEGQRGVFFKMFGTEIYIGGDPSKGGMCVVDEGQLELLGKKVVYMLAAGPMVNVLILVLAYLLPQPMAQAVIITQIFMLSHALFAPLSDGYMIWHILKGGSMTDLAKMQKESAA